MKYKEKLLELVFDTNDQAFPDWLTAHPLLEQVEILKELKQMAFQNMFKSQDFSISETLKEFTTKIEEYEKAILVELEAESAYNKALEEQAIAMQEMEKAVRGSKQYVINCIVNKESNAEEMKGLAQKIIALEKEQGIYNAEFWAVIV
jgi:hypothetical protein